MVKFITNPKFSINHKSVCVEGVISSLDHPVKIPDLTTQIFCSPTASVFVFYGNTFDLICQICYTETFFEYFRQYPTLCIHIPAKTTELNKTQDIYIMCNPTNIQLS